MAYRCSLMSRCGRTRRIFFLLGMATIAMTWMMSGGDDADQDGKAEGSKTKEKASFVELKPTGDTTDAAEMPLPLDETRLHSWNRFDGSQKTKTNPDADDESKVHILIFSAQRSGSSFLGEVFKQHPDIFYAFEPVRPLTFDVLEGKLSNRLFDVKAREKLYDFFKCKNANLRYVTRYKTDLGFRKRYKTVDYTKLCRQKRHVAVKEIRFYDLKGLQSFAEDPSLNFKIVHLVRDPRAIINSRAQAYFRNHDFMRKGVPWDEVTDLCNDMQENLRFVRSSPTWLRGKYILLRYEDLASEPLQTTKHLYSFIGVKLHDDVIRWILQNTKEERGGALSTTRNSTERVVAWKQEMSFDQVNDVQLKCADAMTMLGYLPVADETAMRRDDANFISDHSKYFLEFPYRV
ncbi:carbohydrate sulfotransferase 1-like [Ptychodera flava]|uniref:carbohydrate sulfotransferase 1-like n=1 Tax=Ptychodera flava TaxID=63121 RepID=UPI00396A77E6